MKWVGDIWLLLQSITGILLLILGNGLEIYGCLLLQYPRITSLGINLARIQYMYLVTPKYLTKSVPRFHYSITRLIWYFVRPKFWQFFLLLLGSTVMSQQTALYSLAFGSILDQLALLSGKHYAITWDIGGQQVFWYFSLGLVITIFYAICGLSKATLIPWFAGSIRKYFVEYILGHSYFYFSQTLGGDIISRVTALTGGSIRILEYVVTELIPVILLIITTLFYTIRKHPEFRLSLITWIVIHLLLYISRISKYNKISLDNARRYTTLMGVIGDIINNIFAVKVLYSVRFEEKYFGKFQHLDIASFRKMYLYERWTSIILDVVGYLVFYSFIFPYQLIRYYIAGQMTLGTTLSIFNILRSLASQLWKTTEGLGELMMDASRCKDAMNLLSIPHGVVDRYPDSHLHDGGPMNGYVELKNVYFCYSRQVSEIGNNDCDYNQQTVKSYLFDNLNLVVSPNSRVALVGSSGSGKSTLVSLILRLFDPIRGTVMLNGQDVSKVSKTSLRNSISFIPQKQFLFQRSIFENIGYGCSVIRDQLLSEDPYKQLSFSNLSNETQQRIVEAARKAECHDFVIKLDKGYDSVYGADMGLSGGQCQRLMIARALINRSAKFLILDEATSALDAETEQFIKRSIDVMSDNRTVIVIAHKLNTIKDFDRIIVFDKGEIVEDNTHEELLKQNGKYKQMWEAQQEKN